MCFQQSAVAPQCWGNLFLLAVHKSSVDKNLVLGLVFISLDRLIALVDLPMSDKTGFHAQFYIPLQPYLLVYSTLMAALWISTSQKLAIPSFHRNEKEAILFLSSKSWAESYCLHYVHHVHASATVFGKHPRNTKPEQCEWKGTLFFSVALLGLHFLWCLVKHLWPIEAIYTSQPLVHVRDCHAYR